MRRLAIVLLVLVGLCSPASAADFQPDPRSVRRSGPGYRYPQAGWIVLHIEGEPYERGYQHGQLLAAEIAALVRCSAAIQNSKAPAEGWKQTRTLVNALFLRRFDKEYIHEMKGIADGASAAGAKFDGRAVDLLDIVGINCWAEIETLDAALEATPTGLEGIRFPKRQPDAAVPPKPMHCSAFAATGPATADGKIVFGHNTMYDLYPSSFFNVWLDVKPTSGQRVCMQTSAGGIESGMDYYMNSAGILISETTIAQTRFDPKGQCLASRIRRAAQYADTIDKAVEILSKDNNGLYTNEWLLADTKTNEIAMFELGTTKTKLWRSSKGEWFGGTEGFYWGCNNAKDVGVRLDTVASVNGKPANVVWKASDRDKVWLRLYEENKGKIDVAFGKKAYGTAPLVSSITCDAKFTTTDLAKDLKTWALFGPPLGKTWQPTDDDKQKFPEIKPLAGNPWALITAAAPADVKPTGPAVVDLPDKVEGADTAKDADKPQTILRTEDRTGTLPAWHGTLLPKTEADTWLATAFADFEKIVSLEHSLRKDGKLTAADRERLGLELFGHRSNFATAARARVEVPLNKTRSNLAHDDWYRVASGKGVLLLHELRQIVGETGFDDMMEAFGKEHAGKEVTADQFRAHVEKTTGKEFGPFFDAWLTTTGLPSLKLERMETSKGKTTYQTTGHVVRAGRTAPGAVTVTVETDKGDETKLVLLEGADTKFHIRSDGRPSRVVVDKYGAAACSNGAVHSVLSFLNDLDSTLIVYGTGDEVSTNREAAEALQEAIRVKWSNQRVPIKADRDVRDEDLKKGHVLLIGRPDSNTLVERFQGALPIKFRSRSFETRDEAYAHPGSGVIAAGDNPLNKRYSLVVLAGLAGESTLPLSGVLLKKDQTAAEVLVVPAGGKAKGMVISPKELIFEVGGK